MPTLLSAFDIHPCSSRGLTYDMLETGSFSGGRGRSSAWPGIAASMSRQRRSLRLNRTFCPATELPLLLSHPPHFGFHKPNSSVHGVARCILALIPIDVRSG